jgi:hypothetical protein
MSIFKEIKDFKKEVVGNHIMFNSDALSVLSQIKDKSIDFTGLLTMKDIILKHYNVFEDGTVIRKSTNTVVKFSKNHKGYLKARIFMPELSNHKDKRKPMTLHRIIACVFLDNFSNDLQVNHKNGIKTDNRLENLEMVTASENSLHGWNLNHRENRIKLIKEKHSKKHLQFDLQGNFIKEWVSGAEVCRELKIDNGELIKACRGERESVGGFIWKYKNDINKDEKFFELGVDRIKNKQ